MLEDDADSVLSPDFAVIADVPAPEPDVVDNARCRLASRYPASGAHYGGETPAHRMDDVRAVSAVIDAVRGAEEPPAHALDVGAGLVLVCNLRLYLDRLEADLLDAAQQVDLSWDLIAAIIGIPVKEAQIRHRALRARPEPHQPA
jgi:hypothetical protein